MIIQICDSYRKYTNGSPEFKSSALTLGDALEEMFNRYPQFMVHLTVNKCEQAELTAFRLNGEYVWQDVDLFRAVTSDCVLEIEDSVPAGAGAAGKIVAGVVLMAVGVVAMGGSITNFGASYPFGSALFMMGLGMVMGGVAEAIIGTPRIPKYDSQDGTSSAYTFSGIKNTTTNGTPVSIVYGKHRVGGHYLNVYSRASEDARNNVIASYVYMLVGLCEGPIESLDASTIEINKRKRIEYSSRYLEAYHRMGTREQEAPLTALVPIGTSGSRKEFIQANILIHNAHLVETIINTPTNEVCNKVTLVVDVSNLYTQGWVDGVGYDASPVYVTTFTSMTYELFTRVYGADTWTFHTDVVLTGNQDGVQLVELYLGDTRDRFQLKLLNKYSTSVVDGYYATEDDPNDDDYGRTIEVWHAYGEPTTVYTTDEDGYPAYITKLIIENTTQTLANANQPTIPWFNQSNNTVTYGNVIANPLPKEAQEADANGTSINLTTLIAGGGLEVITETSVDTLEVVLSAPVLYSGNEVASVTVRVYYALFSGEYTEGSHIDVPISGRTKSEKLAVKQIQVTTPGKYKLKLVRLTREYPDDINRQDTVYLKYVTESKSGELLFPYTALVGYKLEANATIDGSLPTTTIVVKGSKVKVPDNYDPVTRTYSGTWGGGLKASSYWTDNTVWCIYDLITHPRYGLKDKFAISDAKLGIVLANFYDASVYCDQRLLPNGEVVSSTQEGYLSYAPRYSLNVVIDDSRSSIEWLNTLCATVGATWYYTEGCFLLDLDRADKPISCLFNMSNIKDFTENGSSLKSIPNAYEVSYVSDDASDNFEQKLFTMESEEVQLNSDCVVNKKTLNLKGVTHIDQCKRLTRRALIFGEKLTKSITFKTGAQGLLPRVGSVFGLQHDVPVWGCGTRLHAVEDTGTAYKLTLPSSIIIHDGAFVSGLELDTADSGYNIPVASAGIMISHAGAAPETFTISGSEGANVIIVDKVAPVAAGDVFIIGAATNIVKPFKAVALKRDKDDMVEITAVEYLAELYAEADDLTNTQVTAVLPNYSQAKNPTTISVAGFKAEPRIYADTVGMYKQGVDIFYTPPMHPFWTGVLVYYGIDGVYTHLPLNTSGYLFIPEIFTEGDYGFVACSVYADGTTQSIDAALSDSINAPYITGLHLSPFLENAYFMEGVRGLEVFGKGNDYTFEGKDCEFAWRQPRTVDASQEQSAGSATYGAATAVDRLWLSHYQVEIFDADNPTIIRRPAKVYEERYTYTHEMNHTDGLSRTIGCRVIPYDRLGRPGAAKEIIVTNPAPAALV